MNIFVHDVFRVIRYPKHLQPSTFNLQPSTFNLQPSTFNLQPSTFNLQPSTFKNNNLSLRYTQN
ncbi:hypothetical protein B9T36_14460 [Acinetobacter sp. ANC 4204]|nr:hypothetical protein B9T36_14460 [Acinetobacter sp. ANC 4204]